MVWAQDVMTPGAFVDVHLGDASPASPSPQTVDTSSDLGPFR